MAVASGFDFSGIAADADQLASRSSGEFGGQYLDLSQGFRLTDEQAIYLAIGVGFLGMLYIASIKGGK